MPRRFLLGLLAALLLLPGWSGAAAPDETPTASSPFLAREIEVTPGEKLMLRLHIPYVEGLPDSEYTLAMSLPVGVKESAAQINTADRSTSSVRVDSVAEGVREVANAGQKRTELFYRPDLASLCEGIAFNVCLIDKQPKGIGYVPLRKFVGDFDWLKVQHEYVVPDNAVGIIPWLIKWEANPTYAGVLRVRNLQVRESATGKVIFSSPPGRELALEAVKNKTVSRCDWPLPEGKSWLDVTPGAAYTISYEAKGEEIRSPFMSASETLKTNQPYFTRTIVLDLPGELRLPNDLVWRIEDKSGHVYREGRVALVLSGETHAPRQLETSFWLAETWVDRDAPAVLALYMEKLRAWGFNTALPEQNDLTDKLDASALDLTLPAAQEALRLGMRTRPYTRWYHAGYTAAREYCEAHPEYWAVTYKGDRTPDYRVCLTHALDGGKYDDPLTNVGAGKDNPWLGRWCDLIKRTVQVNHLDGLWIDHEISGAPFRKDKVIPYDPNAPGQTCMCRRCRQAVADHTGLDRIPTAEECCGPLYDKFVDFRCWQHVRCWRILAEAAREANPQATFGIYSGAPDDNLAPGQRVGDYCRQAYGVDWMQAAPYLDFAMIRVIEPDMPGVLSLRAALQKGLQPGEPFPKILVTMHHPASLENWRQCESTFLRLKNNIVRLVAFQQSAGWTLDRIHGIDDQLARPLREANRLIAQYEDFFVSGKLADGVVQLKAGKADLATWQDGDGTVTFVLNDDLSPQTVVLSRVDGAPDRTVTVPGHDCLAVSW
jgi:hypothetical protein